MTISIYYVQHLEFVNMKDTYACFIDFTCAFDLINNTLLMTKLCTLGVWGKLYNAINSLYRDNKGKIKIDNIFTDWFPILSGIRQGDVIAPTMFTLYVNDRILEIKDLDLGIPLTNNEKSTLLIFADDIVLLANSPSELQTMINKVSDWCKCWRLFINTAQHHVIHFRASLTPLSDNIQV